MACEVVWAEVATFFPSPQQGSEALHSLGVRFVALSEEDALEAAARWSAYRTGAGGGPRRIAADFLLGAHALRHSDRLLTRDQGFYRAAFKGLVVFDPTR